MRLVTEKELNNIKTKKIPIQVGVSNRHVHLSEDDLTRLFGEGYQLKSFKALTQPGEFASTATVTLIGPKNTFDGVRVVGPLRDRTQIEISITDGYSLGVKPPIRLSGDLDGTPGITIKGPKGKITLDEGLIVAARHIHLTEGLAKELRLKDGDKAKVQVEGIRAQIFDEIIVRVKSDYFFEFHVDMDEANGSFLKNGDQGFLLLP